MKRDDPQVLEFAARIAGLHNKLVRIVTSVTGDASVAEDAAQEALVRLWEINQRGERLDDELAWATRVALNWARSRYRRRSAEERAVRRLVARRSGPEAHDPTEPEALPPGLKALLMGLPRRQREVAVLFYVVDLDVATIASITGASVSAVKNALFHARRALATIFHRAA